MKIRFVWALLPVIAILVAVMSSCVTTSTTTMPPTFTLPMITPLPATIAPDQPAATVSMTDGYGGSVFWPPTVTVSMGATVLWTNNDSLNAHTVTSDDGLFESGSLTAMDESALHFQDATFSYTFTERGIFKYHCSSYPWMVGEVIVE